MSEAIDRWQTSPKRTIALEKIRAMSALGHKQTCAVQEPMSALPPKADMCTARGHVCFGPIADIAPLATIGPPLNVAQRVN